MRTFTASRRAAVATAVGLALPLSLVAFSLAGGPTATPASRYEGGVPCSLLFIYGDLVADNGRTALVTSPNYNPYWDRPLTLNWPDGWEIRATDGGQLDVLDGGGTIRGRTGTFILLNAVGDNGGIRFVGDGELEVCPAGPRPAPRPDDWTTETPHIQP